MIPPLKISFLFRGRRSNGSGGLGEQNTSTSYQELRPEPETLSGYQGRTMKITNIVIPHPYTNIFFSCDDASTTIILLSKEAHNQLTTPMSIFERKGTPQRHTEVKLKGDTQEGGHTGNRGKNQEQDHGWTKTGPRMDPNRTGTGHKRAQSDTGDKSQL